MPSRLPGITNLVTAPLAFPVTLAEVKDHVRRSSPADDLALSGLLAEVVDDCEEQTRRALLETTFDCYLPRWPGSSIWLPRGRTLGVTSVKYTDEDGVENTVPTTVYDVDTVTRPRGRVYLKRNQSWPTAGGFALVNPVVIRFAAGMAEYEAASFTSASGTNQQLIKTSSAHGLSDRDIVVTTGLAKNYERIRVLSATELQPIAEWPELTSGLTFGVYRAHKIPATLCGAILRRVHDRDRHRGDVTMEPGITSKQTQDVVQSVYRRFHLADG